MTTDLSRYSRQIVLRELGVNGQQLLADSGALVIGMGGLGCAAAPYLVGAGVGRVTVADRDRVELSNLQRQPLYTQADIGRPKSEAARERLALLNRDVEVTSAEGTLTPERLAALVQDADVVLDCTDNFPTRFAINAECVRRRRPLVSGAAIRFEGQVAVFDARRADSPCYACVFPEAGEIAETCEEAGILGPVVATIGGLQALAALKLLLGRGDDVGKLRVWDALSNEWKTLAVNRDPRCPNCASHE